MEKAEGEQGMRSAAEDREQHSHAVGCSEGHNAGGTLGGAFVLHCERDGGVSCGHAAGVGREILLGSQHCADAGLGAGLGAGHQQDCACERAGSAPPSSAIGNVLCGLVVTLDMRAFCSQGLLWVTYLASVLLIRSFLGRGRLLLLHYLPMGFSVLGFNLLGAAVLCILPFPCWLFLSRPSVSATLLEPSGAFT